MNLRLTPLLDLLIYASFPWYHRVIFKAKNFEVLLIYKQDIFKSLLWILNSRIDRVMNTYSVLKLFRERIKINDGIMDQ